MRRLLLLSFITLLFLGIQELRAATNSMHVEFGIRFGFFFSSLSPHGEWIEIEPGFQVWRPFHVARYWRPYLHGRWIWTEYGWYWMSREPFGWITYHYGRWYYDDFYGWVWVPDDVWGPAWVEWRYTDEYIGWAPLPPYAVFHVGIGIRFTTHWFAPHHYWNFVKYHHFGSVIHPRYLAPEERTRRLIRTSRSGPQFDVERDRIINRGIDRVEIERRGKVIIPRAEIQDVHERAGERMIRSDINRGAGRIEIYRPSREELQRSEEHVQIQIKRGERALSLDMSKIGRQRTENRNPRDEQIRPQDNRTKEQQGRQDIRQEEKNREYTPNPRESEKGRDREEMRRELKQRYERTPSPSPPINREGSQFHNRQKKDYGARSGSPYKTAPKTNDGRERTK